MSQPQQKVVAIREPRVTVLPERDFWLTMRQSLLIQLANIERKLGIERKCKHCGQPQS